MEVIKNSRSAKLVTESGLELLAGSNAWHQRLLKSVWFVSVLYSLPWTILILAVHRNSPRTLISFHGLLHAAIAGQFLTPGAIAFPPENPFYAGQPLPYYWFFHFLAAQVTRVLGCNVFYSFELITVISTFFLVVMGVSLGLKLFGNRASGFLMTYLIMAGTNPLGWLHAIYNIVRGGPGVLTDTPNHLWGITHPLYSLIRYNDVGGINGPLLNFFLNITSRPAALAGLFGVVFFLAAFLYRRSLLPFVGLLLTSAATTAFSPIIGIAAGGCLIFGLVTLYWGARLVNSATRIVESRVVIYCGAAIVGGVLLALPTYYHLLLGQSSSQARFTLLSIGGIRQVVGIGLSVTPLFILAIIGTFRAPRDRRLFLLALIIAALPLIAITIAFTFVAGNESNFFHAGVVLLSVPAAGVVLQTDRITKRIFANGRITAGVILFFLPTTLLLAMSYFNRPPVPVNFDSTAVVRTPENVEPGSLYAWVKHKTEVNAVFVINPRERVAICGNAAEFPAMTGRAILTEDPEHYIVTPYPDLRRRVEIADQLLSGMELRIDDSNYLSKLHSPIYIVSNHPEETTRLNHLRENYGDPVFHDVGVSVFKWKETQASAVLGSLGRSGN